MEDIIMILILLASPGSPVQAVSEGTYSGHARPRLEADCYGVTPLNILIVTLTL